MKWLQVYIKSKYNLKKFILKKALLNDFENLKKKTLQGFCKENRDRDKGLKSYNFK